jgi:hypothetical protein
VRYDPHHSGGANLRGWIGFEHVDCRFAFQIRNRRDTL